MDRSPAATCKLFCAPTMPANASDKTTTISAFRINSSRLGTDFLQIAGQRLCGDAQGIFLNDFAMGRPRDLPALSFSAGEYLPVVSGSVDHIMNVFEFRDCFRRQDKWIG